MKKSGHFPTSPWPFNNQGMTLFRKEGDNWVNKGSGDSVVRPYVEPVINTILGRQFETAGRSLEDFIGAVRVSTSGSPTPPPPDLYQEWSVVKVNNSPFMKKVNNDEIVVSDFQKGANHYTLTNGGTKSNVGSKYNMPIELSRAYLVHGMYSIQTINGYVRCLVIDNNTAIYGSFGLERQPFTISDERSVYSNGFSPFDKDFFVKLLEVNSNLVTSVTSDANRGSVDILTAMAELPKALSSILNACKFMLKLYTDCKKGELRLQNKAKQVRMTYDEAVLSLNKLADVINNGPGSKRFKRQRIRALAKQRKQLKQQLKLNLDEILDAISNVWLNYRYNITPNVLLIKGALDAVDKSEKKFARWASTSSDVLSIPEGYSGTVTVQHRCQIKRLFKSASIGNHLSSNPLLTAWELVPLSFTIDWFINIGDSISALTFSPSNITHEGATYSWKVQGTIFKSYPDGSKATVQVQGYKRIVIDPSLYCRLSWNPDFNAVRQLDALALTWKLTLKRFLKLKD